MSVVTAIIELLYPIDKQSCSFLLFIDVLTQLVKRWDLF
jgi:hypothetical protein